MDWLTTWARDTQTGKRWTTHHRHAPIGDHDVGPGPHARAAEPAAPPSEAPRWITLDGSTGEGDGQILPAALTLSLLTGIPFRLVNTRADRENPGFQPRHLKTVEVAAAFGNAVVTGAALGARELTFRPGPYTPDDFAFALGSEGSPAVVLRMLHLPIALRAESPVRLTLSGEPGHTDMTIWRARMAAMGAQVALREDIAGDRLDAWIEPARLRPLALVSDAPIDPYSAEALLIPLALAPGRSEFAISRVTGYLRTSAWTVQAFVPRRAIRIEPAEGRWPARVIVEDRA